MPLYFSHGKSFVHLLYFQEFAADDGTAHGLLEGGASFVESSSLSEPSLRPEVANLEELEPKKLLQYPSLLLNLEISELPKRNLDLGAFL